MPGYLRTSETANWGLHALHLLALSEKGRSAGEMAELLGASRHTLQKVMRRLSHAGIVQARRGPEGGFALARPPESVTCREALAALDDIDPASRCLFGTPICGRAAGACRIGEALSWVNSLADRLLGELTLRDLINPPGDESAPASDSGVAALAGAARP